MKKKIGIIVGVVFAILILILLILRSSDKNIDILIDQELNRIQKAISIAENCYIDWEEELKTLEQQQEAILTQVKQYPKEDQPIFFNNKKLKEAYAHLEKAQSVATVTTLIQKEINRCDEAIDILNHPDDYFRRKIVELDERGKQINKQMKSLTEEQRKLIEQNPDLKHAYSRLETALQQYKR